VSEAIILLAFALTVVPFVMWGVVSSGTHWTREQQRRNTAVLVITIDFSSFQSAMAGMSAALAEVAPRTHEPACPARSDLAPGRPGPPHTRCRSRAPHPRAALTRRRPDMFGLTNAQVALLAAGAAVEETTGTTYPNHTPPAPYVLERAETYKIWLDAQEPEDVPDVPTSWDGRIL
jgi:hypothetical protein